MNSNLLEALKGMAEMIIVVTSALTIVLAFFKKIAINTIKKTTEQSIEEALVVSTKVHDEQMQDMLRQLNDHMQDNNSCHSRIERSLLANSRDRINQAYDFYSKCNSISAHAMFTLEEVYKCYKDMHGNNFIDGQMERLRSLPRISE